MYNKRQIGNQNEELAIKYLEENGYRVRGKNFYCKTGEIDIIAKEGNYLVFIEVKYRTNHKYGLPTEAVDFNKMRKITRTALFYMLKNNLPTDTPIRFDVVVLLKDELQLIKNAFEAIL
jgi:putative endonuclease